MRRRQRDGPHAPGAEVAADLEDHARARTSDKAAVEGWQAVGERHVHDATADRRDGTASRRSRLGGAGPHRAVRPAVAGNGSLGTQLSGPDPGPTLTCVNVPRSDPDGPEGGERLRADAAARQRRREKLRLFDVYQGRRRPFRVSGGCALAVEPIDRRKQRPRSTPPPHAILPGGTVYRDGDSEPGPTPLPGGAEAAVSPSPS